MYQNLSPGAWATLAQLATGGVWDGELVSKSGRTELIKLGLARRERVGRDHLLINELTQKGLELAVRYQHNTARQRVPH